MFCYQHMLSYKYQTIHISHLGTPTANTTGDKQAPYNWCHVTATDKVTHLVEGVSAYL